MAAGPQWGLSSYCSKNVPLDNRDLCPLDIFMHKKSYEKWKLILTCWFISHANIWVTSLTTVDALFSWCLNYAYDSIVAATYRKKKYQPHSQNTWRELSWPFLRRMEAIPGFSCRGWIWWCQVPQTDSFRQLASSEASETDYSRSRYKGTGADCGFCRVYGQSD